MTKFEDRTGSLLSGAFLSAETHRNLRLLMPAKLRSHAGADQFLIQTDEAAQFAKENVMVVAAGPMKSAIEALALAAAALNAELQPFAGRDSEYFDSLQTADFRAASKERLAPLLTRLDRDLRDLRDRCGYVVKNINPSSAVQPQKASARFMTEMVARSHLIHFGKLPPKKSWFAPFMAAVGESIEITCGSGVVAEAIAALKK